MPGWPDASIPLTDLLGLRGAYDEAEVILRELLAEDPDLAEARWRLDSIERRK